MKLFSVEMKIVGTLYIKAETKKDAWEIAKQAKLKCVSIDHSEDIAVDGGEYRLEMPDVSLSPVATCQGPNSKHVEFVAELSSQPVPGFVGDPASLTKAKP